METVGKAPKKAKQDFSVGATVRIGGNEYRVTGQRPPPAKGQAAVVELVSLDMERRYEWQPFRGLKVIGAPPKRIRKRRKKGAVHKEAQATLGVQKVEKVSLWRRVFRAIKNT